MLIGIRTVELLFSLMRVSNICFFRWKIQGCTGSRDSMVCRASIGSREIYVKGVRYCSWLVNCHFDVGIFELQVADRSMDVTGMCSGMQEVVL